MLLKGRLPACGGQARQAISGSPARPTAAHRRRHAAFKGGRQASSVQVSATAEPAAAAAGAAPARGPRAPAREVSVRLEEVEAGDEFTGTVTAVEAYGAFVNFGAEKDGLCHISQLKDGYVSSAADAVSVGEEVQVRVLSVDAASGKIALTMKGMQEGEEGGMDAGDDEEEEDEGAVASLVYGDDRTDFSFPFQVEADEGELTPEALAEAAKSELEVEHETDLELPLNELVHGKVTKVDGVYGAYITVTHNGREIEAYLDRDEAKVPSAALSAEDLLEFVGEGEPVPEYIDIVGQEILYEDDEDEDSREEVDDRFMFEDMSAYYKEGDEVTAFVLGFDSKRDMMALTHFTDAEVQGDALEALGDELAAEEDEEDEGEGGRQDRDGPSRRRKFVASAADEEDEGVEDVDEDEVPLARLEPAADFDPLSFSPEELMAMEGAEDGDGDDADGAMGDDDLDGEAAVAIGEYKVFSRGLGLSTNSKRSIRASDVDFPTRPSGSVDPYAMQGVVAADTDFDGDEIYLDDIWQDGGLEVSDAAWKKLGLKIQFDESGEAEVVEREGGAAAAKAAAEGADAAEEGELAVADDEESEESLMAAASADHDARVASWVSLLLEDDGDADEAEVPAFAMRRPVVLAVSVEPAAGAATAAISAGTVKALRDKTGAGMMDCKKALGECGGDTEKAIEWLRKKGLSGADKKAGRVAAEGAISQYIHPGSRLGVLLEVNCETDFVAASDKFRSLVGELGMIIAASPDVMVVTADEVPAEVLAKEREVEMGKEDIKSKPEAVRAKIVEGRLEKMRNSVALVNQASLRDPNKTVAEIVKETIAAIGENVQIRRFVKYRLGEGLEKRSNDFAAEVAQQTQKKEEPKKAAEPKKEPEAPKAAAAAPAAPAYVAPAALVKELRDKTGAGMMDCKKALAETAGDTEKAMEWLRKKGLSGADKKAGRVAAEGVIAAYIHPGSRLGVVLEVNCETDFVARSDPFNALVNGLAMQIAASPMVQYVSADEIPAEVFEREKQIEMGREDLKNKPEAIRAKIAEGRTQKLAQEMALLPQPYLMDNSKTVEQAVKEAIASIGEKISIRRFVRYQLGEGIEKKVMDLAADVAAMTKSA